MADPDNTTPETPSEIPPKQVPFKPAEGTPAAPAAGAPGPVAPTLRRPVLRRPGEAPPNIGAPSAAAAQVRVGVIPPGGLAKKETSRVPLPTPPAAAPVAPAMTDLKTVKVKPLGTPQPGSNPLPDGPKPPSESQVQAAKSKTSRISLEAALGAVAEQVAAPPGGAPKTIRLKRPADLPATRATAPLPPGSTGRLSGIAPGPTAHIGGAAPTATGPISIPSSSSIPVAGTARLPTAKLSTQRLSDLSGTPENAAAAPAADSSASMTRRKTIKVKRPASATPAVVASHAADTAELPPDAGDNLQSLGVVGGVAAAAGPDRAHWTFVVAASLTLVTTLGLIWILSAQSFGPNAAVTGYSKAYGPDIAAPIPSYTP